MVRLRLSTLLLAAAFGSMVGCSSTSRFNLFHRNTTTTEVCPDSCGMDRLVKARAGPNIWASMDSTMLMPEATFPQGTMLAPGTMPPQGTVLPMAPTPMATTPPPGTLQTVPPQSRLCCQRPPSSQCRILRSSTEPTARRGAKQMLDATSRKIVQFLTAGPDAAGRLAAARVLADLAVKDKEVTTALVQAVEDPDPSVRLEAIRALGKLGAEAALPTLLEKIKQGGPESAAAAEAAARFGARAVHTLQDLMGDVALDSAVALREPWREAAPRPLAQRRCTSCSTPTPEWSTPRLGLCWASCLASPQPENALADEVLDTLKPRKGPGIPPASEAALLRLLAGLHDARALPLFWSRVEPDYPEDVRAAALQALGSLAGPIKKDHLSRLLSCACAASFRIVAPALLLLKPLEVEAKSAPEWLKLFESADPSVRRFGLDKLADVNTAPVRSALCRQLLHPDRTVRDRALELLAQTSPGKAALLEAILETKGVDEAWTLARGTAQAVREVPAPLMTRLFEAATKHLEASDRRADPLFFLLREMNSTSLRDNLAEKAQALRKKKDYARALLFLRFLGRDPACAEDIRFEAAACALKLSDRELDAEHRAKDPCLQDLARLIHSHDQPPLERLREAKWLVPEELFYLGFHFAESSTRQEREFGSALLDLVQTRASRTKLAKDARSKQRALGLA